MVNNNHPISQSVTIISILLLSSSLPFIKSFTRTTHQSLTAGRAKIAKNYPTPPLFNQRQHDGSADQSNREEELQFHMLNLLKIGLSDKLESLSSIMQSCKSVLEDGDEVESVSDNMEVELNLPENLSAIRRFINKSSRPKDHRGCFRVFSGEDGKVSLTSNVLLSMDRPFTFLRDSLSYQTDASEKKRGGMMYDGSEAVVWCSLQEDLTFTSRVLDDMPFSQLYLGIDHDDDYLDVELDMESVNNLESLEVLLREQNFFNEDGSARRQYKIKIDDLNVIQTLSSSIPDAVKDEQQTLIKLIDAAVEFVRRDPLNDNNEPHLVLLAHSVSCSVVASAISSWKDQQLQNQQSLQRVEDLLYQALTVVTFGNVCQSFCNGPAYIHISMWDDPWTAALGAHSGNVEGGGGQNAVYFEAWSPYDQEWEDTNKPQQASSICSLKSRNAHNLNSCLIQYLCLIMRINGIQSFRALYDSARFVDPTAILDINPKHFAVSTSNNHGELVIPPRIDDELLLAMIYATGGDKWLWDNGDESHLDFYEVLPDEIESRSHLEEHFGYSVFEEIRETCCRQKRITTE